MLHISGYFSYLLAPQSLKESFVKLSTIQIFMLRLAIGGLFLTIGFEKIHEGWLTSAAPLAQSLNNYRQHAAGPQLTYLDTVAIPYAGIWSRLMALGETAVAVSLLLGLLTRLSSLVAMFMVVNFHAATGNLFSLNFFGSPWAAPLMAGLLVIFLARGGRWGGLDALLAGPSTRSLLW
jgi:uncharacterized membrane protein YphA (DoxX/SURF4 family)